MSHKNGYTPQCVRSQQRNLNVMGSFCAFELGSSVRDNRQMSYFSATIHLEGLLDLVYTLLLNNARYTCSIQTIRQCTQLLKWMLFGCQK